MLVRNNISEELPMISDAEQYGFELIKAIKDEDGAKIEKLIKLIKSESYQDQQDAFTYIDEEGYTALMLATTINYDPNIADLMLEAVINLPVAQIIAILEYKKGEQTAALLVEDKIATIQAEINAGDEIDIYEIHKSKHLEHLEEISSLLSHAFTSAEREINGNNGLASMPWAHRIDIERRENQISIL